MSLLLLFTTPFCYRSNGPEWKNIRVNAGNQILPRRVANFTEPLAIVADELIEHLERIKDENGNVQNMRPELQKWAFKGKTYSGIQDGVLTCTKIVGCQD